MTHSPLTKRIILTSDCDSRNGTKVDRFIIHHAATTSLDAIISLFRPGGREVSANYALKDRQLICTVDERNRAWTSGSAAWDNRAITIEVANSKAGGSWPVSSESFDTLARLIADVSKRYGFPINDNTVLTHQELYRRYGDSYATACPGDLQRRKGELLRLANKYRGGKSAPSAPARPAPRGSNASKAQWRTIQDWLKRLGRYGGPVDGVPGQNTWKGIQATIRKYGYYNGPVDGVPGTNTYKGMQMYARDGGGYRGPVDGVLGPNSWTGFVKRLSS